MNLTFDQIDVKYGKGRVLHKVYGQARKNEILAIIGPSGCGKSTLLNALTGRVTDYSGLITVGKESINKQIRRQMAYITQEDVFLPNLTLRETLMFHAMLKLPDQMSYSEKCERMADVTKQFELTKCMNTRMGDASIRGLSGGERKRASIACEMICDNRIFVADEPTSGLDSASALQIMDLISTYVTKKQMIAIVALHQPSHEIFQMCSNILVLSSGKVAFYGKRGALLDFLRNVDLHCPSSTNLADFVLLKLNGYEDKFVNYAEVWRQEGLHNLTSSGSTSLLLEHSNDLKNPGQENQAFDIGSPTCVHITDPEISTLGPKWNTGFCTQFQVLCKRALKQEAMNLTSFSTILCLVMMTIFCGLLWYKIPHTADKTQSRIGLIFFLLTNIGFEANLSVGASFHMERTILTRERFAGMYRLSAYYLAKLVSICVVFLPETSVMFIVVYWMAGMADEIWIFVSSFVILYILLVGSAGVGMFISCLIDNYAVALVVDKSYYICLAILGGFFVENDTSWFGWTKYISIFHFATGALSKLQFLYHDLPGVEHSNITNECSYDQMIAFESKLKQGSPVWLDVLVLALYSIFYWLLGYIILRWVKGKNLNKIPLCT